MKKMYKCRVCGYVLEREEPTDVCPACGVKGKIFEDYDSPLSRKRRKLLDLYIHAIMVHFPIAFVFSTFLLSLLISINIFKEPTVFTDIRNVIIWVLPFTALSATAAGLYDGKLRFKRLNTPYLKKKLILAVFFILFSVSVLVIQEFFTLDKSTINIIILIFSFVLSGFALLLGFIGGKLLEAKVRG